MGGKFGERNGRGLEVGCCCVDLVIGSELCLTFCWRVVGFRGHERHMGMDEKGVDI